MDGEGGKLDGGDDIPGGITPSPEKGSDGKIKRQRLRMGLGK